MISLSPGLHGVSSLHGRAMMPYRREIDHLPMRGVVGLIELHRLGYRPNIVRPPVLLLVVLKQVSASAFRATESIIW